MAIIAGILRGFALTLNKELFFQIYKKKARIAAGVQAYMKFYSDGHDNP
ncbi:hypothetical protein [Citrobacter braakii]|nr:hypothetical protein [Citrobacter braakii]QXC16537.1 hypothetical protein I6L51_26735 [Citrobacter braakii]